ncbi:S-arrestin [Oryzias melastigma]|uniref:S-arrestin n=1 Tax=Oryzias melastigma TaxID=30732 RepID=A0A834F107_ORYME|nr:S-arrestin [Oryzias melastigma]
MFTYTACVTGAGLLLWFSRTLIASAEQVWLSSCSICFIMSPKNVIFKKTCKDKSVGVFMGKRDFVDRVDSVDPVDGVILIDPEALAGRKVFVTLSCTFRYGRDDMDVMGIAFRRELYLATRQVYPPLQDRDKAVHTRVQAKLLRKLGNNAYPFFFEFPDNLPCSVALQPGPHDVGKQCAVEFEIKAFSAESQDAKVRKRSTVKLMLRKVQYAPEGQEVAPSVEITKDFVMSDKPLHVQATLDKELYYHGEPIKVHVNVTNDSNKNIKNIILSVDQVANVVLYSNDNYSKCVDIEESGDSVSAGAKLQKVYTLLPLLANNRERRGIALDGKLKHEDTNLASSSVVKEGVLKEVMGIMVSYKVMVKLIVGGMMGSSEVGLEVPFRLMHPKPDAVRESEMEEEMVFEEFKRSYLKGIVGGDDDEEEGNVSGGDDMTPREK